MSPGEADCKCLEHGPRHPHSAEFRSVGVDETSGRFGEVGVNRCTLCGRLWLRYFAEYEGFSSSGRWATCLIDQATAAEITPEQAPGFIARQPWHIFGGSYYGHAGERGVGPARLDL